MATGAGGTAVGVQVSDGVVLAATSRVTSGGAVTGKVERIEQVHETGAVAAVGSVGDAQSFIRTLDGEVDRRRLENRPLSAQSLATRAGDLAAEHGVDALVGAVTPNAKDYLFLVDAAGGVTSDNVAAVGTGQQFALGVLETNSPDSLADAHDLTVDAIRVVSERSATAGDGGYVATVTEDGVKIERVD